MTSTMTAWRQEEYGGPEVVRLAEMPVPTPGKGEVLLRVRAVGLNAADQHVMRGEPLVVRPVFGLRRPRVVTRGMDVAGTVVEIGEGSTRFAVDDEVIGELAGGGLAEYVVAPESRLVPRPPELDPVAAAALPIAGGTARQALDAGRIVAGHRVLVIGASGGVGTFTVQLAVHERAEVWALCGARSMRLIEELGASRIFDYRETSVSDLPPASFDVVFDIAGTASLRDLRSLVRRDGTLVLVSGEGGRTLGPIGRILRSMFVGMTPGARIRPLAAVAKPEVTRDLAVLTVAGRIRPVIERTWPLAEAGAALAHIDAGHTVGKVVVTAD